MLADFLPHRQSWLREVIDPFLLHLAGRRYARSTLLYNARLLAAFGDFAEQHGHRDVVQLPLWVNPFVATMRGGDHYRWKRRLCLLRFIRFLYQQKIIPVTPSPPPSPDAVLMQEHLLSLLEQRGLCAASIEVQRRVCQALIEYLAAEGVGSLQRLRPEVIHRFITWQGQRYCRDTLRQRCSILRNFLSFLYRRAVLPLDLASAVVAPRVYRHEQCPRFLTRTELDAVLAAINRHTPTGKRDYAMFLLLATYGLRGMEVVRLRLDDVLWREQMLQVRGRKAGNNTTYPLSAAVGEAILVYLRTVRPVSPHREVFLTMRAPFAPLFRTSLRNRVLDYLRLAKIEVAHPGTHSFRYSCAQRLFEQGLPLKSIGDFLGHRDPNSTERYTKIALDQLREVAAGDGEELL
jgi:site-specific recombinase XerD